MAGTALYSLEPGVHLHGGGGSLAGVCPQRLLLRTAKCRHCAGETTWQGRVVGQTREPGNTQTRSILALYLGSIVGLVHADSSRHHLALQHVAAGAERKCSSQGGQELRRGGEGWRPCQRGTILACLGWLLVSKGNGRRPTGFNRGAAMHTPPGTASRAQVPVGPLPHLASLAEDLVVGDGCHCWARVAVSGGQVARGGAGEEGNKVGMVRNTAETGFMTAWAACLW